LFAYADPARSLGRLAEVAHTEFAVVDLETTGFSPARGDRIVEIGVVRVLGTGEVLREWTTLLDPGRSVGAGHVHRITAADVADAPSFAQVATEVAALLAGAVVVAHNASFEQRFLHAEFVAAGMTPPTLPALCTMKLAKASGLPLSDHKLGTCCAYFGLTFADAHAALADARVTARLLPLLLASVGAGRLALPVPPARAPQTPQARPAPILKPRRGFAPVI
jgi:DNA polymerase III subunit epsilon